MGIGFHQGGSEHEAPTGRRLPPSAASCRLSLVLALAAGAAAGRDLERSGARAPDSATPPGISGRSRSSRRSSSSNAGVDSNVFYSPAEPVKDFTLTAGPAATVYLPIHRKFVLSAYGSPQYVWYSKTEQERTWNYYFSGAAQLNLKNVFLSARRGLLGRPGAVEHGDRYPAATEREGLRRLGPGATWPIEDLVLPGRADGQVRL